MVVRKNSRKRSKSNKRRKKSKTKRRSYKNKQYGGYELWINAFDGWNVKDLKKIATNTLIEGTIIAGNKSHYVEPKNYISATILNFYKDILKNSDKWAEEMLKSEGKQVTEEAKKKMIEDYKADAFLERKTKSDKKKWFKLRLYPA